MGDEATDAMAQMWAQDGDAPPPGEEGEGGALPAALAPAPPPPPVEEHDPKLVAAEETICEWYEASLDEEILKQTQLAILNEHYKENMKLSDTKKVSQFQKKWKVTCANTKQEQERLIFEEKKYRKSSERLSSNLETTASRIPVIEASGREKTDKLNSDYNAWEVSFQNMWRNEKKKSFESDKEKAKRHKAMVITFEQKIEIQNDAITVLKVNQGLDKENGKLSKQLNGIEMKIKILIPQIRDNERLLDKVTQLKKLYNFQMEAFAMNDQRFKFNLKSLNEKKQDYDNKMKDCVRYIEQLEGKVAKYTYTEKLHLANLC